MSFLVQLRDLVLKPEEPSASKEKPDVVCLASPGLMTLLDTALYRTYEGQLTSTTTSANATLHAFLELKSQAKQLLHTCNHATLKSSIASSSTTLKSKQQKQNQLEYSKIIHLESFAQFCIDCASEAITQLTTDKIAITANLPTETSNSAPAGFGSHEIDVRVRLSQDNAWEEVALRLSSVQQHELRKKDCWESTKLFCPDYVWADEAMSQCQRLVRTMTKHDTVQTMTAVLDQHVLPECLGNSRERMMCIYENLMTLLRNNLPLRLHQFHQGIESDIVVSKRLYLIKTEYRAPFRSFLEAHQYVQKFPKLSMVMEYIRLHDSDPKALKERRIKANQMIQDCLRNEELVLAIRIEEHLEKFEMTMAKILLPFCEVARLLMDGRVTAGVVEVPDLLEGNEVLRVQELLRRLKRILCKRSERISSSGIRPLLLDLQGIPRDLSSSIADTNDPFSGACEVVPEALMPLINDRYGVSTNDQEVAMISSVQALCFQLQVIYEIGKANKFSVEKKEIESLPAAIRACAGFDCVAFTQAYFDWHDFSKQQSRCSPSLEALSEKMRMAEIEVSIAMAPRNALSPYRKSIELLENDRQKKFDILQEMVMEICLREMDLVINLLLPAKDAILVLPDIKSVSGLFEPARVWLANTHQGACNHDGE